MHSSFRTWVGLAWSLALAAAGCAGGQTGQPGGICTVESRETVSIAEAAERGFDVRPLLPQLDVGDAWVEHELVLVTQPELWTKRGHTPPGDLAIAVVLRMRLTGEVEIVSLDDRFTECHTPVQLWVEAELEIPELNVVLTGRPGRGPEIWFYDEDEPQVFEHIELDFDELGQCFWTQEDEALSCVDPTYARAACTDESTWRDAPEVPVADLDASQVLARALQALPDQLDCGDGSALSFDMSIEPIAPFCTPDFWNGAAPVEQQMPVVGTLTSDRFDAPAQHLGFLAVAPDVPCLPPDIEPCEDMQGLCFDGSETKAMCDRVYVSVGFSDYRGYHLSVDIDEAGMMTIVTTISYANLKSCEAVTRAPL